MNKRYTSLKNTGWMLKEAWQLQRILFFVIPISAFTGVILNCVQLYIAPRIIRCAETGAPLEKLIETILIYGSLLFVMLFLQKYIAENEGFPRMYFRESMISKFAEKTNETSYINTLKPDFLQMREKVASLLSSNQQPCQHFWTTLTQLFMNLIGFAVYLLILSNLDYRMILLSSFTCVIGFLANLFTDAWEFKRRREEEKIDNRFGYIRRNSEAIAAAKDIRIFSLQKWLLNIHESLLKTYDLFLYKKGKVRCLGGLVETVCVVLRNSIAYWYLIHLTLQNQLSTAQFILYFQAFTALTAWISGILEQFSILHREAQELTALREYLDYEEPYLFEDGADPGHGLQCGFVFDHVSFRYPGSDKDIIHDFSLTIQPGENLAVVGLNGAGKTTLIKLMCGLLDPDEGTVFMNGTDIRTLNRRKYYELFSAVFQDFSILDVTIAETISQKTDQYDLERVRQCAALAGVSHDIEQIPGQYDAHIGREVYQDGVILSGGQMQKLMLARALYKDGSVLLLDEPTAALDPLAESNIYQSYHQMSAGKTSVFISHRLASTRFCDRILFLKDGKILEEGTHEELMRRKGAYADLFDVQSRYYQEGKEY